MMACMACMIITQESQATGCVCMPVTCPPTIQTLSQSVTLAMENYNTMDRTIMAEVYKYITYETYLTKKRLEAIAVNQERIKRVTLAQSVQADNEAFLLNAINQNLETNFDALGVEITTLQNEIKRNLYMLHGYDDISDEIQKKKLGRR
jgi:uncharacterized metal-binding protein